MMRNRAMLMAVVAAVSLWSRGASAQLLDGDTLRIFAVGELGLAGVAKGDDVEFDLSPSYGFAAGADYGLHTFLAVGAMFRWLSISPKIEDPFGLGDVLALDSDRRSSLMDFTVYPRVRLPLPLIEFYVMLPLGMSVMTPPEGDSENGFTMSFLGGAQLGLLPLLSLVAQFGWSHHSFSDFAINEMTINAGLALGF